LRALFRAVYDATERRTGVQDDPDYARNVRCGTAVLMADMAAVFRALGLCARNRVDGRGEQEHVELASALKTLQRRRDTLKSVLIGDPRIRHGLWELNAALMTAVDRMLLELDATMIAPDPDQHRTAQALARLRAAVHDVTHRLDARAARDQEPPESTERRLGKHPCRGPASSRI
jgi:hypothetical protein